MAVTIEPDGEKEWLVKFTDVHLSYPHLFEPYRSKRPTVGSDGKPVAGKYGAKFCFDKRKPEAVKDAKVIYAKIVEMARAEFKAGLPADRYCLRDGSQLTEDMHKFYVLSASEDIRPQCVDRRRNPVTAEDDLFYAGCRVNGTVRLWVQSSTEWGKRINANLVGVQFVAHDERWGGRAPVPVDKMFDDISGMFDDDEYVGRPTGDSQSHRELDDGMGMFGDAGDVGDGL